ncbi:MAG: LLM class flavin-dependent oxidoreductase [Nitrososphaerales archaeon]
MVRPRFGIQFRNFDARLSDGVIDKIGEIGQECEKLSFDSIWMIDHLSMRPPIAYESQPIPECWTTIAYLAERTHRMKLGSLVSCVLFRSAPYLARLSKAIDEVSRGRLTIGLGSGWFEEEFRAYGLSYPDAKTRSDVLEETVIFLLDFFRSSNSRVPEIWIGGSGESRTLRTVARYANACSLFGDPETVRRKVNVLNEYRKNVHGVEPKFSYSKHGNVIIGSDKEEVEEKLSKIIKDRSKWPAFVQSNIVGTSEECREQIKKFTDAGVDCFTLSFPDLFEIEALRLFDESVIRIFDQEVFA